MSLQVKGILAATLFVVTGCETAATDVAPANVSGDPNLSVVAGTQVPTATEAAGLFKSVCIKNLPSFEGTLATLNHLQFVKNEELQVYAHQTYDLSIALVKTKQGQNCSIIFAAGSTPEEEAFIFAKNTATPTTPVYVAHLQQTTDRKYINAQVAAK